MPKPEKPTPKFDLLEFDRSLSLFLGILVITLQALPYFVLCFVLLSLSLALPIGYAVGSYIAGYIITTALVAGLVGGGIYYDKCVAKLRDEELERKNGAGVQMGLSPTVTPEPTQKPEVDPIV